MIGCPWCNCLKVEKSWQLQHGTGSKRQGLGASYNRCGEKRKAGMDTFVSVITTHSKSITVWQCLNKGGSVKEGQKRKPKNNLL
jgi:hypothetical protein